MRNPLLITALIVFSTALFTHAGEYPRTLTAYRGTTPVLDGYIAEGEYADAESVTGVSGWYSDTNEGLACEDSLDLSVRIWYKHDGTFLYFAFDVTDNLIYGTHTERWLPERNPDANSLIRGEGWPWFGDGLEIMMNPSYTWDETKKSVGDGTIWQTIVSTHKSFAGGLEYGGLIQGVPLNEYAWTNYENWYTNEHMKASVRVKSEEEGRGYVVEWRISPNPCMQIDENTYVDLTQENSVGINFEFEDLDQEDDGLGSKNLTQFRHVDYMTKLPDYRKNIAKGFATLVLTPEKMHPDIPAFTTWEDYEGSLEIPANYQVDAEESTRVYIEHGTICANNSLVISDSSSTSSARVHVPIGAINDTLQIQFTLETRQDKAPIQFDLSEGELSVVSFGLNSDGKIYYCEHGTLTEWLDYHALSKYSFQCIASTESNRYDLIVNSDTLRDIGFCDSTANTIDKLTMHTDPITIGEFLLDNLVISNQQLPDLVIPFNECVEDNTGIPTVTGRGDYKLYPNPTSGFVNIALPAPHPGPIIVTDLYGRAVSQLKGTMDTLLEADISSLASGTYLFHFNTNQGRYCQLIQLIK